MTDRIEQLERLSRLRAEGALTEEEFAAEKARLLAEQVGAPASVPAEEADAPPATTRRWWTAAAVAVVLMVIAASAWFAADLGQVPPDQVASRPPVKATPFPSPESSASPTPATVALDETLAFSSPAQCVAGPALDRVFKELDALMESGGTATVTVAGLPPLSATGRNATDAEDGWQGRASFSLPAQTYWHALRLGRLEVEAFRPPESDSSHSRSLVFQETPDKVLGTLHRLGFDARPEPDYTVLDGAEDSCGGAMEVLAVPGGTALKCGWGC